MYDEVIRRNGLDVTDICDLAEKGYFIPARRVYGCPHCGKDFEEGIFKIVIQGKKLICPECGEEIDYPGGVPVDWAVSEKLAEKE